MADTKSVSEQWPCPSECEIINPPGLPRLIFLIILFILYLYFSHCPPYQRCIIHLDSFIEVHISYSWKFCAIVFMIKSTPWSRAHLYIGSPPWWPEASMGHWAKNNWLFCCQFRSTQAISILAAKSICYIPRWHNSWVQHCMLLTTRVLHSTLQCELKASSLT